MTTPSDEVAERPNRPIYAVFEGGGAKGVAHIGALEAIEANKLEVIGVAGTSAGALVAVLVAIGLESRDIMGPEHPATDNILARQGMSPVSLLGTRDWRIFTRLLRLSRSTASL